MKRWISWILAMVMILLWIPTESFALESDSIAGITLDRTEAQISVGMILELQVTIQPEDAAVNQITWESSEPSVVRLMANGAIKAVGTGEAVVTVRAGEFITSCNVTVVERLTGEKTITVPTGAQAQLFVKDKYYSYTELLPVYEVDNKNGTTTFYFSTLKSDLSWRVTKEGMATKAGYWNGEPVVIEADSQPEQSNGSVNENSILLNVNGQNCLRMDAGSRYDLWAFRTWEIVNEITGNHIIMPDFTYTIVSGSNVVELEDNPAPMNGNSCRKTIVAKSPGTAVIEVSYDPIDIFGGDFSGTYSGCDNSRKGLLVVQVGGNTANVNFGIEGFSSISAPVMEGNKGYIPYNSGNAKAWDTEFDTLYFTGTGGSLELTPSVSGSISGVYVSHDKGNSYNKLTSENGTYAATIVPGNNILKVETNSGAAYQVIRGDRLQVTCLKIDGSSGNTIQAGDTVRVRLEGLHQPFPKLAGIYNPGFSDLLSGGSQHASVHLNYTQGDTHVYGPGVQYDFITGGNYVDVKIPESASDKVVLNNGYIGVGVFGRNHATGDEVLASRSHRSSEMAETGFESILSYHTRSVLPEIEIKIGDQTENQPPVVTANAVHTAAVKKNENYAISNLGSWFRDPEGKTLIYMVSVDGGAETGIQGSGYTYKATKEGTVKLTFRATDGEKFSQSHTLTLTVEKADSGSNGGNGSNGTGTGTGTSGGTNVTPGGSTGNTEFGLAASEINGYVSISVEDNGIRLDAEKASITYPNPLGTIVAPTKVPFKSGDSMADVTKRLLDELGIGYDYGNTDLGLYLASIKNFTVNNTRYSSMGEFDAGQGSGWMFTLNGNFINKSSGAFQVSDGDVIRLMYTCQYGKDIGDPFYGNNTTGSQSGQQNQNTSNSGGTNVTPTTQKAMTVTNEAGEEEDAFSVTGNYLANLGTPTVNSIGGEWMVIGLARSGYDVPEDYYDNVIAFVQENINEKQQLHPAKSTENSRLILALTAIGKDVTAVNGHNLLMGLTDMEYLQKQGINGPIWALIAFDSGNYPIPEGTVTRETLIETILAAQLPDGGWALTGEVSDPDMTGMALQALAPYYEKDDLVKTAVDKALTALAQMQAEDGSFASIDGPSSESIAQTIVALTALGIDPDQDVRFVKNGNSVWDALLSYYIPGGGFRHVPDGELDGMSTEQGYYAMVAYYRMLEGKTALYDMTDRVDCGGDPVPTETTQESTEPIETVAGEQTEENNSKWVWAGVLGLCGCALAAVLLNWKKLLVFFSRG